VKDMKTGIEMFSNKVGSGAFEILKSGESLD
jgi:hypothetical protein